MIQSLQSKKKNLGDARVRGKEDLLDRVFITSDTEINIVKLCFKAYCRYFIVSNTHFTLNMKTDKNLNLYFQLFPRKENISIS